MAQPIEETKEIRLFGEKSIREEAYRQKILQLERDIAHLESVTKNSDFVSPETEVAPIHLSNLYYESLGALEKRLKKEHEFFEKKTAEIAERVEAETRRTQLIIESSLKQRRRQLIAVISLTALISIILFSAVIFLFRINSQGPYVAVPFRDGASPDRASITQSRLSYIKTALMTQTKYRHLYAINRLEVSDDVYSADIELNFPPDNKSFLKDLCSEVTNTFGKYSGRKSAEISFIYKGRLYAKAYLAESTRKTNLQYFY